MTVQLYPDQIDLVMRVRQAMRRHKAVLMQSPTGSGKTAMALDMIAGAHKKGSTAIFTVPRRELLAQTIETIGGYGIPFGVISPGYAPNPIAPIQIAMTPTLARRLDRIAPPKALFIDEAHHGGAELERVIEWSRASGGWRIGMSATPLKMNGKGMGEWYEHMEEGPSVSDLIKSGRLADFRYFAPSSPDLSGIESRNGEYVQSQLSALMEGQAAIIGDAVSTYREHGMWRLCLAFATSRKHAGIICDSFRAAGISAMTIDGTMGDDERKRIVTAFARREFTVLVNVQLLTFGFDLAQAARLPVRVEALIDLCPRKSLPMQMQVWGRALRAGPPSLIFDHANNWREHGFPDTPREWTLEGRSKRKTGRERAEATRQCEIANGGCGFVSRIGPPCCPNCGLPYPVQSRMVEEIDGDLAEIDRRAVIVENKLEQAQAQTLEDLLRLARAKGRKPGWAHFVWRTRKRRRA